MLVRVPKCRDDRERVALDAGPGMTQVAIIGAGIIGLATAYELQRRGASVTLIDPRPPGNAASGGNTGWVVPVLSAPVPSPGLPFQTARWMLKADSPFRVDFRQFPGLLPWLVSFWRNCSQQQYLDGLRAVGTINGSSYEGFLRWLTEGLEFEFGQTGVLFVSDEPHYIEHLVTDVAEIESAGYEPVIPVDGSELGQYEPWLSDSSRSGILASREQIVRPESVVAALVDQIRRRGGRFVEANVEERASLAGGAFRHLTAGGAIIQADAVVIAAGAWTGEVARCFGLRLPVIGGKGYSITVEQPERKLNLPLYLADAKIACTPFQGANRFAGMMELTGADDTIDPQRLSTMVQALNSNLPGWDRGRRRTAWAGLRPMTPDGLPVIGRAGIADNVYIATGHGMLGVTMAPVTGQIMAELICDGETSYDIFALAPDRF